MEVSHRSTYELRYIDSQSLTSLCVLSCRNRNRTTCETTLKLCISQRSIADVRSNTCVVVFDDLLVCCELLVGVSIMVRTSEVVHEEERTAIHYADNSVGSLRIETPECMDIRSQSAEHTGILGEITSVFSYTRLK